MIIADPELLRAWLTRALEPICDADPAALAKYVMALLKKPKEEAELKEFCIEQLDVFLQKETAKFVNMLFSVVKEKSYLPINIEKVDAGHQAASNTVAASSATVVKESREKAEHTVASGITSIKESYGSRSDTRERRRFDSDHSAHSSSRRDVKKKRRPSPSLPEKRLRTARDSPAGEQRKINTESLKLSADVTLPPAPGTDTSKEDEDLKPEDYEPESITTSERQTDDVPRQRCRDYDEKGYCMRGDACDFDHGPDPVVVEDAVLPSVISYTSNAATVPLPNFNVPPPGYSSQPIPLPPGVDGFTTEPYNPEAPALGSCIRITPAQFPPQPIAMWPQASSVTSIYGDHSAQVQTVKSSVQIGGRSRELLTVNTRAKDEHNGEENRLVRVVSLNPGQKGDEGSLLPQLSRRRVMDRLGPRSGHGDGCALEVRRIPRTMNNIAVLNQHFSQFGTIVHIEVCYGGDPEAAIVTYQTRGQALAAYKSTVPILNNRFIRVFWHHDEENKDTIGKADVSGIRPQKRFPPAVGADVSVPPHMIPREVGTAKPRHIYASNKEPVLEGSVPEQQQSMPLEAQAKSINKSKEAIRKNADLQKRKAELLEKQLQQHNVLLKQMEQCKNPTVRKEIFKCLSALVESSTKLKEELKALAVTQPMVHKQKSQQAPTDLHKKLADLRAEVLTAAITKLGMVADAPSDSKCWVLRIAGADSALHEKLTKDIYHTAHGDDEIQQLQYNDEKQQIVAHYKTRKAAQQAYSSLTMSLDYGNLDVSLELGNTAVSEDRQLKEQLSAHDILASLDDDSTDDEDRKNGDNELCA